MKKLILIIVLLFPFASHPDTRSSYEEVSRLLFNLNMKLIEVTRRSEDIASNQEAQALVKTGCNIDSIRTMVIRGYTSSNKDLLIKADRCAARLAIALGYQGELMRYQR